MADQYRDQAQSLAVDCRAHEVQFPQFVYVQGV
jgi:hypothetical protein